MSRLSDGTFAGSTPDGTSLFGSPTYDTTDPIEGDASLVCNAATEYAYYSFTGATDITYFVKMLLRVDSLPGSDSPILAFFQDHNFSCGSLLALTSGGNLKLTGSGTVSAMTLSVGTIYVVELSYIRDTVLAQATTEARVNGVSQLTRSTTSLGDVRTPGRIKMGLVGGISGSPQVTIDDWALNNDQGASDNSWPYVPPPTALTQKVKVGGAWVEGVRKVKVGGAWREVT